jgi:CHAT domain-containing protein
MGVDGAFLVRGARSTISTLWEISDLAACLFMSEFYRVLSQGRTVDEAYNDGIRFLREQKYADVNWVKGAYGLPGAVLDDLDEVVNRGGFDLSDPFFWGAFKCSGWAWGGALVSSQPTSGNRECA